LTSDLCDDSILLEYIVSEVKQMENTGGVIIATGNNNRVSPLFEIGSISIIKRIVLTFQKAGIFPIVVVTGFLSVEIEQHIADYGVVFLKDEEFINSDKLSSAKIALDFIKDKCTKVIFTSITIPMYNSDTIKKLIEKDKKLIIPSYKGSAGHPILLDSSLIPEIIKYNGNCGMRGAIKELGIEKEYLEVDDEGIILYAEDIEESEEIIDLHNDKLLHPFIRVSIEKEFAFFNSRSKLLLILIDEIKSVKGACKHMALSCGKAWKMINEMEEALGYSVVERRHGGSRGGKTVLTEKGRGFLTKYERYGKDIKEYALKHFYNIFDEYR
jgi:molybdate transport repressor ModE-like protein